MGSLLFNPKGAAFRSDVIRGALFLSVLLFVIKASGFVSVGLMSILGLLGIALWWMWFALFAKGFRAGGKPAALALLPLAVIVLVGIFIDGLVQGLVDPDGVEALQTATLDLIEERGLIQGGIALQETGLAEELTRKTALAVGVVRGLFSFGVAWMFARLVPETGASTDVF